MKKFIPIIIGVIAVAISTLLVVKFMNQYTASIQYVSVPVPVEKIAPYTTITESHIKMVEYPRALSENEAYALTMDDLVGMVSTSVLAPDLPVAKSLLVDQEDYRMGNTEDEILSIPISPEMAAGGQIKIGENINIYRIAVNQDNDILLPTSTEPGKVISLDEEAAKIENIEDMDDVKVELVASVPVLDILDSTGESLTREEIQNNGLLIAGNTTTNTSDAPAAILMVSVPPEKVDTILRLIGLSEKGGEIMWVTLASVSDLSSTVSSNSTGSNMANSSSGSN